MPSYNSGSYIAESLESILDQSYQDFEIIVVDDGSTDNTIEIVQSYEERVKLFRQENHGSAAARNRGAREAKGKWLAFLDSDDVWAPDKLEHQLDNCGNMSWSHTDWFFIGAGQDGTVKGTDRAPKFSGSVLARLVVSNFVGTSTVLVRRDVFFDAGGFDVSLMALQDWDLWLRIAVKHELAYVPEPLVHYRVHPSSTSRSPRKTKPYHLELIRRIYAPDGVGVSMQHLRRHTLAASYGVLSIIAEESNDHFYAFTCALCSACYRPSQLYRWKNVARATLQLPLMLTRR